MDTLLVYTDGGSKGNPGESSIGIAIYYRGKMMYTFHQKIGIATNNEAEYKALITALEYINSNLKHTLQNSSITCFSDSSLMVNQVNGKYKIKKPHIRDFIMKIRILEKDIGLPIKYSYVPREKNKVADLLVNQSLS